MPRLKTNAGRARVRPPRAAVASAARQRPSGSRAAARRPAAAAPAIPPAAVKQPAAAAPLPAAAGSSAGTINISPVRTSGPGRRHGPGRHSLRSCGLALYTAIRRGAAAACRRCQTTAVVPVLPPPAISGRPVADTPPALFAPGNAFSVAVSASLRQQIAAHKCVDLGMLLDTADATPEQADGVLHLLDGRLRPVRASKKITSFAAWTSAILRFAGIYLDLHPSDALGLITHMQQVSSLLAPGLG